VEQSELAHRPKAKLIPKMGIAQKYFPKVGVFLSAQKHGSKNQLMST
jgi:hypothetical protein